MEHKDQLKLIKNTLVDTKFVLDDAIPVEGIYKVFSKWSFTYVICTIALFLYTVLFRDSQAWWQTTYLSFYGFIYVLSYILPPLIYVKTLKETDMTLKEKTFLKSFIYIPFLLSVGRIFLPLAFSLNFEFLIVFFTMIPLDIFFCLFSFILLYNYLKNPKIKHLAIFTSGYLLFFIIIQTLMYENTEIISGFLFTLYSALQYINSYNILIICLLLISTLIIKKDLKNEN